jgi:hypothetical protein
MTAHGRAGSSPKSTSCRAQQALVEEFGDDWRFVRGKRSDGGFGELMATRTRTLTVAEERVGLVPTLPAGYTSGLRDLYKQLCQQTELAKRL